MPAIILDTPPCRPGGQHSCQRILEKTASCIAGTAGRASSPRACQTTSFHRVTMPFARPTTPAFPLRSRDRARSAPAAPPPAMSRSSLHQQWSKCRRPPAWPPISFKFILFDAPCCARRRPAGAVDLAPSFSDSSTSHRASSVRASASSSSSGGGLLLAVLTFPAIDFLTKAASQRRERYHDVRRSALRPEFRAFIEMLTGLHVITVRSRRSWPPARQQGRFCEYQQSDP